jgi:hypothetical protein
MTHRRAAFLMVTALAFAPLPAADDWRTFDGTWSAAGSRQTLSTGTGRAAIARLSGAVVLSGGAGSGFTAEATFSGITPQASSANLLFAGSGFLSQRDLYRLGGLTMALSLVIYLAVGTPWLRLALR